MRLADFILSNVELILAEWEIFARSIGAGEHLDRLALRDHARTNPASHRRGYEVAPNRSRAGAKIQGPRSPRRERRSGRSVEVTRGRSSEPGV